MCESPTIYSVKKSYLIFNIFNLQKLNSKSKMSIRWENVPDSEVRAEVEACLESQGEANQIRQFLHDDPAMNEWREQIRQLCRDQINEKGIDNLTPDMIYDQIAATARDQMPASLIEKVKSKLKDFLQAQFEDHI